MNRIIDYLHLCILKYEYMKLFIIWDDFEKASESFGIRQIQSGKCACTNYLISISKSVKSVDYHESK